MGWRDKDDASKGEHSLLVSGSDDRSTRCVDVRGISPLTYRALCCEYCLCKEEGGGVFAIHALLNSFTQLPLGATRANATKRADTRRSLSCTHT